MRHGSPKARRPLRGYWIGSLWDTRAGLTILVRQFQREAFLLPIDVKCSAGGFVREGFTGQNEVQGFIPQTWDTTMLPKTTTSSPTIATAPFQ